MRKTAIVTGVGGAIGAAVAAALIKEGVSVIGTSTRAQIVAHEMRKEIASGALEIVQLDFLERKQIDLFIKDFSKRDIDILVNNAAVFVDDSRTKSEDSIFNYSIDELEHTLQVNCSGAFRLCWAFMPSMIQRNHGRIVNVSSGMGRVMDICSRSTFYSLSKLLLNGMTIALADAARNTDVLVNAVCPGWTRSLMGGADAPNDPKNAATQIVRLALLPAGGSQGRFWRNHKELDWSYSLRGERRMIRLSELDEISAHSVD